jgi:hypothetical protein
MLMEISSSALIVIGVLSGALSAVSLGYGFVKIGEDRARAEQLARAADFSLAESTFDLRLQVPHYYTENPHALGQKRVFVIVNIRERGSEVILARFHLNGEWDRDDGIITRLKRDSVTYVKAESTIVMLQMNPVVEFVEPKLRQLVPGREYEIDLTADPGFAFPLTPSEVVIRTKSGVPYVLREFLSSRGWYTSKFVFQK